MRVLLLDLRTIFALQSFMCLFIISISLVLIIYNILPKKPSRKIRISFILSPVFISDFYQEFNNFRMKYMFNFKLV